MGNYMSILNYGELKDEILSYLDYYDAELIAQLPNFVQKAELEVLRILRSPIYEKVVQLEFDPDQEGSAFVPNDLVEGISMLLNQSCKVVNKMPDFASLVRKKGNITPTEYDTYWYARVGTVFQIYPIPEPTEQVFYTYYATPRKLVNDSDYVPTLELAPDVLLYLSLKHAMVFLRNDEDAAKYQQMAQAGVDGINFMKSKEEESKQGFIIPPRRWAF